MPPKIFLSYAEKFFVGISNDVLQYGNGFAGMALDGFGVKTYFECLKRANTYI